MRASVRCITLALTAGPTGAEPTAEELPVFLKVKEVLDRAPGIIKTLSEYTGAKEEIREVGRVLLRLRQAHSVAHRLFPTRAPRTHRRPHGMRYPRASWCSSRSLTSRTILVGHV